MRLAKLKHFRDLIFAPGSGPCLNTLRAQIKDGKIVGGKVEAGHYYVDLDEYDQVHGLHKQIDAQRRDLSKSPALQGLL